MSQMVNMKTVRTQKLCTQSK